MFLPFQVIGRQSKIGETAQDGFKDDLCLQPDERRADAEMDPHPKPEVTSLAAGDVEPVRVREALGVAVGGGNDRVD